MQKGFIVHAHFQLAEHQFTLHGTHRVFSVVCFQVLQQFSEHV
jgi:hypothetical protein